MLKLLTKYYNCEKKVQAIASEKKLIKTYKNITKNYEKCKKEHKIKAHSINQQLLSPLENPTSANRT